MSELKPCPVPTFRVIDHNTGKEADECEIALNELWASRLCYCDMEGWAIEQDGTLILMDECSQFAYPPKPERFEVVFDDNCAQPDNEPLTLEQIVEKRGEPLWYRPIGEDTPFDYGPMWFICNLDKLPKPFYSYGKTWLAYDHKPGGEQDA